MILTNNDRQDIQGLLCRAYGKEFPEAQFVVLTFDNRSDSQAWLQKIQPQITNCDKPSDKAIQLAFTQKGICHFIPSEKFSEPFSREFQFGLTEPTRSRALGDVGTNSPAEWNWGGGKNKEVHAVLMLYAKTGQLGDLLQKQLDTLSQYNVFAQPLPPTSQLPEDKEHFGFKDGISNPTIKGFGNNDNPQDPDHDLETGEFILGHKNAYGKIPFSPKFDGVDFGRNGSYLVIRQLEQKVSKFWNFMKEAVHNQPNLQGNTPVYLASKMVGRWPDGNIVEPEHGQNPPHPIPVDCMNAFRFQATDPKGMGCPIGSHIRKSNPRDGFDGGHPDSIDLANKHRILRRGRTYGKPLVASMRHDELMDAHDDNEQRGLYFVCFNASLNRQFEFIQQAWDNNQKFDGLFDNVDPLIGVLAKNSAGIGKTKTYDYKPGEMSIPNHPVRQRVKEIPQFVIVKGGAYFFMPSLSSISLLANYQLK